MSVATRPLTKTVYEITELGASATDTHATQTDLTNHATHGYGLTDVLVEVTDGVANFDLSVANATDRVDVYSRTGLKFLRFLMNVKYDFDTNHLYNILIKNNDDEAASYKVTYSAVEYTLEQTDE